MINLLMTRMLSFYIIFKEFLYYVSTDSFSVENSTNEIYRKYTIKQYFLESNEYS